MICKSEAPPRIGIDLELPPFVPFWVYMLACSDGSFYVGHTDDTELRLAEHASGAVPGYTTDRPHVVLVYSLEVATREEAIQRERQIKGWNRAKKRALIRGQWSALKTLARGPDRARKART